MATEPSSADLPELSISLESVCFIVLKAREFDAKDLVSEPDPGSNASDDDMISVLEDHGDDPSVQEITQAVEAMDVDEQLDLIALAWLGRGDYTIADWGDLRAEAADARNERTAAYLLGMPLLSDYLEEGLSMFGLSCSEIEAGHL